MKGSGGGGGIDVGQLDKLYCRREAPDNTLKRIEALENALKDAQEKLELHDTALGDVNGVTDLAARVAKLEDRADSTDGSIKEHGDRLQWCEDELKKLKSSLEGMGKSDGNFDNSAVMMRINMLSEEMKSKVSLADLKKLREEMQSYTSTAVDALEKKVDGSLDGLRYEIERLRADFE